MWIERWFGCFFSITRMKPKTVREVMMPVTFSGWIVGMGVIEYPSNNPWPATSFLYTIVLIAGYGLVVEVAMDNVNSLASDMTSEVGKYIFIALFYGNVCLNICGTLLGWIRMKGVKKIVRCLEISDANMSKMGIEREYRIIYLRQCMGLIFQLAVVLTFMGLALTWTNLTGATTGQKIANAIAVYYPVIQTSVGDTAFVTLVRFMGLRFSQLNKYLKTMSTATNDSPQHKRVLEYTRLKAVNAEHRYEKKTRDDPNEMRAAREYHHELIIISQMINDTFGMQILFSMSVSFVLITGLLYYSCTIMMSTSSSQKLINEELMNASLWLVFYIYRIVIINSSCARTSAAEYAFHEPAYSLWSPTYLSSKLFSKANKIGNIICHLHEPSTKKEFRDEIRDFTLQLSQHCLTFTACGFFTLNYGFIQGMIGSITTYLVILIQIGEMPPARILANSTLASNETDT